MLLISFLLLAVAVPRLNAAEPARITVLLSADIPPFRQALEGFRETVLASPGKFRIIEHNLVTEGSVDSVLRIAGEKPLLVSAIGPDAAKFAMERLKNIPLVFSLVLNPQNFAGPNITGVSMEIPVVKKLEKIRRILPGAARVGVFYSPGQKAMFREVLQACRVTGLQAEGIEIGSGKDLNDVFASLAERIDLILMVPDTKIYFPKSIEFLLVNGLKYKIPVVGLASSYTRAGAIVSFEADYTDMGRQAGNMALRIADGEDPSNIEPAGPRRMIMSVNLTVAERLGISIPQSILKEAGIVFR